MISDEGLKYLSSNVIYSIPIPVGDGNYVTFIDIADMARELLRRREVDRWIPVEERLPETHGRYAVLINALGTSLLAVAYYYPAQKCFKSISSDGETFPNVTHWRDLPEPPEAQNV